MGLMAICVIGGVVAGLARGGSLRAVGRGSLRRPWLLGAGVAGAALAEVLDQPGSSPLLLIGFIGLVAFALTNLAVGGLGVVAAGLLLNVFVVTLNDGMPVRASALVGADLATWDEIVDLDLGAIRHVAHTGDRLTVLGDAIPIPPLREVVSFGDLILGAGLAAAVANLLAGAHAGERVAPGDRRAARRPAGAEA